MSKVYCKVKVVREKVFVSVPINNCDVKSNVQTKICLSTTTKLTKREKINYLIWQFTNSA